MNGVPTGTTAPAPGMAVVGRSMFPQRIRSRRTSGTRSFRPNWTPVNKSGSGRPSPNLRNSKTSSPRSGRGNDAGGLPGKPRPTSSASIAYRASHSGSGTSSSHVSRTRLSWHPHAFLLGTSGSLGRLPPGAMVPTPGSTSAATEMCAKSSHGLAVLGSATPSTHCSSATTMRSISWQRAENSQ